MSIKQAIEKAMGILREAGIDAEVTKMWGGWQTKMVIVLPGVDQQDLEGEDGSNRTGSDE